MRIVPSLAIAGAAAILLSSLAAQSSAPKIDFSRHVRPILSDNCFSCHGPDEKNRFANLRLDDRDSALRVLVPGKRNESKLFQRLNHAEAARRMPPPGSSRTLNKDQIELIGKWIDQGAEWRTHWSYAPLQSPALPTIANAKWARNPIDHFVLARLEKESLKPAPEADRATLIRRLTLDLTGLPPTPAEVSAFLNDKSPDAYEKLVNRLLESPHYGEKMSMLWLDLSRYADTHGYHIDSHRDMWPWRDWVIQSFNRNKPFNRFILEQIAGDLLPNPTREQLLATGFNRNHMINYEGGAIPEEYLTEYIVDRVETTAVVFMGMTMGCARCHDHKYDPISQKDFYRFFSFFHNVDEKGLDGREGNAKPVLPLPTTNQQSRLTELEQAIAARNKQLPAATIESAIAQWEPAAAVSDGPRDTRAHYPLDGAFTDSSGHYHHARLIAGNPTFSAGIAGQAINFDGESHIDWGNAHPIDTNTPFAVSFYLRWGNKLAQTFLAKSADGRRGFFIEMEEGISIGDLKRGARLIVRLASSPNSAIELRTNRYVTQSEWTHLAVSYDGSGKAAGLTLYLDGSPAATTAVHDNLTASIASPAPFSSGNRQIGKPNRVTLDDLRIYSRALSAAEARQLAVEAPVHGILATQSAKRSKEQKDRLREFFLSHAAPPDYRQIHAELKKLTAEKNRLDKEVVTSMVMTELPAPRDTFILGRGDYRNRTEKVSAAVPASLPPLPAGAPANRLGLAQWLTDPSHPLTARVAVNRFWQIYFGAGIVETSEDLGSQGAPPTHPELLDWLASEFIRSGWDVKHLQKTIVLSSTYRQASQATPELIERDPQNKLYARMSRFRLPAELVRDNALAAAGLLNASIGGRSVYPYQPAGLWEELAYGDVFSAQTYTPSSGQDLYRRSMYTFWKRTVPPAQMATFDAPDREKCVARRARTNTPLQALVLMNDPTYIEAARTLAQRVLSENKDAATRVKRAFQLAAARTPTAPEIKLLSALATRQLAAFRRDPESARKLLANGESKPAANLDTAELAAWTTVTSAILNLDEVISKE